MIAVSLLFAVTVPLNAQCYSRGCVGGGGGHGAAAYETGGYVQPIQQLFPQHIPQQLPQPQPSGYDYKMTPYARPPIEVLPSTTREIATVSLPPKSTEYEDYGKRPIDLKPSSAEGTAAVYETPIKPSSTYIREMPYRPYPQPPMPYRPLSVLPSPGCYVVQPQYYRPASYMPRGYMMPYAPTPSYAVAPSPLSRPPLQ
ncbi:unnamed protein product [Angiostrongylus costaricensis]|uniref:VM domain-containing protein n=1 Tax=Angiostrongylus costaricensis TaxID=334426 RepID=A0A158PIY2_ANGCS|nr:unnamed protein product [Angiostrongylus costaricensis]